MRTFTAFFSLSLLMAWAMPLQAKDDAAQLQASLKTWQKVKAECKGNYSYKVRFSSFAGFGNETEIVVEDNKVVGRNYREFNRSRVAPPGAEAPKATSWVERGDAIGSHKKGAPPKTLDELYQEAAKVVQLELAPHDKRYVRTDSDGLLLACFVIDTRIADDAPRKGVNIASIAVAGKVYKAPNGKPFPAHWGAPPLRQTRDLRPLPGGYGRGSGTLAKWIQEHLDADQKADK